MKILSIAKVVVTRNWNEIYQVWVVFTFISVDALLRVTYFQKAFEVFTNWFSCFRWLTEFNLALYNCQYVVLVFRSKYLLISHKTRANQTETETGIF